MSRGPIPNKPANRPTVPDVLDMVRQYLARPENFNGGELHVQLADGNIGEGFWDVEVDDPLAQQIVAAMRAMTPTQRSKVYRHRDAPAPSRKEA